MSLNREESIIKAEKFLEDIVSFFGMNLEVSSTAEDDVIELSIPSSDINSLLIGKNADNLRSLQHIVASYLSANEADLIRVNVDVADYKKQRADRIARKAEGWILKVRSEGEDFKVNLNAADRRIVHKVAQDYSDIETHSEGEGRERVLVISKK